MQKFSLTTLGCKVNQYDGNVLARLLRNNGYSPAAGEERPDLVIINTCCVTNTAMRKCRQAIRKALRRVPEAAVLIAGCYSDYDGREIQKLLDKWVEISPLR